MLLLLSHALLKLLFDLTRSLLQVLQQAGSLETLRFTYEQASAAALAFVSAAVHI